MRTWIAVAALVVAVGSPVAGQLASRPTRPQVKPPQGPVRQVIFKSCTSCHGKEGRAGPDGYYPRIAGKPAGYLYNQLLNFRDGRRHYGLMTRLVDPLSEPYLFEIAQYFASLDLPYPPPQAAATRSKSVVKLSASNWAEMAAAVVS